MYRNGEGLAVLIQFISYSNSFKEPEPKEAVERPGFLEIEYKYKNRPFCVIIPKKKIQPWNNWSVVAVMKNDKWIVKTGKIYYYSGPCKNFHGFGVCPRHISLKYEKMAFKYKNGAMIHVLSDEAITEKLKKTYEEFAAAAILAKSQEGEADANDT